MNPLEKLLTTKLKAATDTITAQAAEIERLKAAQQWQPVAGEQAFHLRNLELIVENDGAYISLDGGETLGEMYAWLPDDIRLCRKAQPHAATTEAQIVTDHSF
jgi:hypothetical protein